MNTDVLFGIVVGVTIASVLGILVGTVILRAVIKDRDIEERKLNSEIIKKQGYAIEWMRKYEALNTLENYCRTTIK